MTLSDLADKVESLTGPCRETDAEICVAVNDRPYWVRGDDRPLMAGRADGLVTLGKNGPGFGAPAYTDSLDAAMTLVPEGWWIKTRSCRNVGAERGYYHCDLETDADIAGRDFADWEELEISVQNCWSLPLALTAASLRARAANV